MLQIETNHKNQLYFIVILLSFIILSFFQMLSQSLAINSMYLIVLCLVYSIFIFIFTFYLKAPFLNVIIYIYIICTQYLIIGLAGHFTDPMNSVDILYLLLNKEILSIMIFIILLLNYFKINGLNNFLSFEKIYVFFLIYLLFNLMLTDAPLTPALAYTRNFIMILVIYSLGRLISIKDTELDFLGKFLIIFTCLMTLFGFTEKLLFSNEFWEDYFNVSRVYAEKTGERFNEILVNGLPIMWYTILGDFNPRRLVSFYMEPVNLSYFYVVPIGLIFLKSIYSHKNKYVYTVLFFVNFTAFTLTFGKGGLLVFGLGVMLTLMFLFFKKYIFNRMIVFSFLMVLILLLGIKDYIIGSAGPHLMAILHVFPNLMNYPFGHGIGMGGNYGRILGTSQDWLTSGGESGLASLAYQLGIPGLFLVILFFISTSKYLYYGAFMFKSMYKKSFIFFNSAIMIGLLIGSLFQENAFTPNANSLILISVGIAVNMVRKEGKNGSIS